MSERPRVWLGADPGVTAGAIALVSHPTFARAWPLRGLSGIVGLVRKLSGDFNIAFALVEQVGFIPGDEQRRGIKKLMESSGAIVAALEAEGIRMLTPIAPRSWQARLGCPNSRGDKSNSRARATELFPNYKVTNQNADALLLAYLCQWDAPHQLLASEPYKPQPRSWRKFKPPEKRL